MAYSSVEPRVEPGLSPVHRFRQSPQKIERFPHEWPPLFYRCLHQSSKLTNGQIKVDNNDDCDQQVDSFCLLTAKWQFTCEMKITRPDGREGRPLEALSLLIRLPREPIRRTFERLRKFSKPSAALDSSSFSDPRAKWRFERPGSLERVNDFKEENLGTADRQRRSLLNYDNS